MRELSMRDNAQREPDLATRLACDIAHAFSFKAKQLGADVSIENLTDFHDYVQGTIADALNAQVEEPLTPEETSALERLSETISDDAAYYALGRAMRIAGARCSTGSNEG